MRKAYVDLGANEGKTALDFALGHPEFEIICIEANRAMFPRIMDQSIKLGRPFTLIWGAAWTADGTTQLFRSAADPAATVMHGKVEPEEHGWPPIDYARPETVPCMNFGAWLHRQFRAGDEVHVKMDIEGAEYPLLDRMLADDSIDLLRSLTCEWHYDRFPSISQDYHEDLRRRVAARVSLTPWD